MNAATQVRLTLDVDNSCLAHANARGDATRPAEGVTADLQDRETVDLANFAPMDVDEDNAVGNQLADFFFQSIRSKYPALESLVHVAFGNQLAIFFARPERCFPHQVADRGVRGEHLFAVARLARAKLNQAFHRAGVKVR